MEQDHLGESAEDLERLRASQAKLDQDLLERQAQEFGDFERKLQTELDFHQAAALEALQGKQEQIVWERQQEQHAEIAARPDLSEAEMQQIMREHAAEMATLNSKLSTDLARQHVQINAKLSDRLKAKKHAAREKQELERARERSEQQKEMQALRQDQMRGTEQLAIVRAVKEVATAEEADDVIAQVLHKRHVQELVDLRDMFDTEMALALATAKGELDKELMTRHEVMEADNQLELDALEAEAATASPEDMRSLRRQLGNAHAAALADLAAESEVRRRELPGRVQAETDIRLSEAQLRVKERHYREYVQALRDLAPEAHANSERAAAKAAELDVFRESLEQQQHDDEERQHRDAKAFKEEQEVLLQSTLQALEEGFSSEEAEMTRRRQAEQADSQKRMKEQEEAHRQQRRELFEKHKSERVDKAKENIDQVRKQQEQMNRMMDADRARQEKEFREKLLARKRKAQRTKDEKRLQTRAGGVTNALETAVYKPPTVASLPLVVEEAEFPSRFSSRAESEASINEPSELEQVGEHLNAAVLQEHLQSSMLLQRIKRLQTSLRHGSDAQAHPLDKQLTRGMEAVAVTPEARSAAEAACLMIGQQLITSLDLAVLPEIRLASEVPSKTQVAHRQVRGFAGSVFVASDNVVWIRREWFCDLQVMLPMLLHVLATIESQGQEGSAFFKAYDQTFGKTLEYIGGKQLTAAKFADLVDAISSSGAEAAQALL